MAKLWFGSRGYRGKIPSKRKDRQGRKPLGGPIKTPMPFADLPPDVQRRHTASLRPAGNRD